MSRSLTPEEHIFMALRRIIHSVDLHSRRLVERTGLTGPQLALLREAARMGKPMASELAEAIHLSRATVTGILDRLEMRGLIERIRNGHDRRSIFVQITTQGETQLKAAPSGLQEQFLQKLGRLEPWEQNNLLATLQRVVNMMQTESEDAPSFSTSSPVRSSLLPTVYVSHSCVDSPG